jgi:NADPH:quinone reductase-like Zn-dependent oxidoreductase
MQAAVVHGPGGPDVLKLEEIPVPAVKPGWVLVRIHAFGLNRSELMTRAGHSGDAVKFPRVLGIEGVGEVADPGDSGLHEAQPVLGVMGGMGRDFDGGYAQYALLPATNVIPVRTALSWEDLAAIPETFGTAWGSLELLGLHEGQTLLIRGGTSSVGMAAATLAKARGVRVIATTRQEAKSDALEDNGVDHIIIDTGSIAAAVRAIVPNGADAVLELVGPTTIADSIAACSSAANACLTGFLDNVYDEDPASKAAAASGVTLHRFRSSVLTRAEYTAIFQEIIDGVEAGTYRLNLDRAFPLAEIVAAHEYMEANRAVGKVVGLA